MRISDWSADVCSSDLCRAAPSLPPFPVSAKQFSDRTSRAGFMLIDARSLQTGTEVETDLCIIGAGPAGLTIAKALGGKGIRTALLESGGPDFETEVNQIGRASCRERVCQYV